MSIESALGAASAATQSLAVRLNSCCKASPSGWSSGHPAVVLVELALARPEELDVTALDLLPLLRVLILCSV